MRLRGSFRISDSTSATVWCATSATAAFIRAGDLLRQPQQQLGDMRSVPPQQLGSSASATAPHAISTCSNLCFNDPAAVTALCSGQQLMLQRHATVTALCSSNIRLCFSCPVSALAFSLQIHLQRSTACKIRSIILFSVQRALQLQHRLQPQRHAATSTSASASCFSLIFSFSLPKRCSQSTTPLLQLLQQCGSDPQAAVTFSICNITSATRAT